MQIYDENAYYIRTVHYAALYMYMIFIGHLDLDCSAYSYTRTNVFIFRLVLDIICKELRTRRLYDDGDGSHVPMI